jgi:hypothetical protein
VRDNGASKMVECFCKQKWSGAYALTTLPDLMHPVQTRMRLLAVFTFAFTVWRFTFQRRRVVLLACEMLLPNCGFLPHISHTCAMIRILTMQICANVDETETLRVLIEDHSKSSFDPNYKCIEIPRDGQLPFCIL